MSLRHEMTALLIQDISKLESSGKKHIAESRREFIANSQNLSEQVFFEMGKALLQESFIDRVKTKKSFRRVDRDSSPWQQAKILSSLLTHIIIEADYYGAEMYYILHGPEIASSLTEIDIGLDTTELYNKLDDLGYLQLVNHG